MSRATNIVLKIVDLLGRADGSTRPWFMMAIRSHRHSLELRSWVSVDGWSASIRVVPLAQLADHISMRNLGTRVRPAVIHEKGLGRRTMARPQRRRAADPPTERPRPGSRTMIDPQQSCGFLTLV